MASENRVDEIISLGQNGEHKFEDDKIIIASTYLDDALRNRHIDFRWDKFK